MAFWKSFRAAFGEPSERPESYWSAALGYACHLRPSDLGELTPQQLVGCADLIGKMSR